MKARLFAVAGAVLLATAGCGLLPGAGSCGAIIAACSRAGPDIDIDLPEHVTYRAIRIVEAGEPRPILPGTEITLTFRGQGELQVYAGCNHLDLRAHDEGGGRLVVDQLAMTALACLDDRAQQDAWLYDFFAAGPGWGFDLETLFLRANHTEIRLVAVVDGDLTARPTVSST